MLYHTPLPLLSRTVAALVEAIDDAVYAGEIATVQLTLIDNAAPTAAVPNGSKNGGCRRPRYGHLQPIEYGNLQLPMHPNLIVSWVTEQGNIGYGAANNLALLASPALFHLVLNPDVEMARDCLGNGLRCLKNQPNTVLISPVAKSPTGEPLYLAKRMPSVDVLFLRGFAPSWLLRGLPLFVQNRLARYEYREIAFDARLDNLQIASGAFMLLRQSAVQKLNPPGFDPRYFLYFEDFDLSLRLSKIGNVAREPSCKIVHAGGGAGKKGLKHIAYFVRSALWFFWQHKL